MEAVPMIVSVWLMHKAGSDRIYTSTVCPDRAQLDAYVRDGFEVFRANVLLPIYPESEVFSANAVGERVAAECPTTPPEVDSQSGE
jgi:hypothetical protein